MINTTSGLLQQTNQILHADPPEMLPEIRSGPRESPSPTITSSTPTSVPVQVSAPVVRNSSSPILSSFSTPCLVTPTRRSRTTPSLRTLHSLAHRSMILSSTHHLDKDRAIRLPALPSAVLCLVRHPLVGTCSADRPLAPSSTVPLSTPPALAFTAPRRSLSGPTVASSHTVRRLAQSTVVLRLSPSALMQT